MQHMQARLIVIQQMPLIQRAVATANVKNAPVMASVIAAKIVNAAGNSNWYSCTKTVIAAKAAKIQVNKQ